MPEKTRLTTNQAILKAVQTKWVSESEICLFVRKYGIWISGSSATRRLREIRSSGVPITGRWFKNKRGRQYKYGIAE